MSKTLIFLTERYPTEYIGSIYEQKEIENLEDIFDKIIVFTQSSKKKIDTNFYIPKNVQVRNINKEVNFFKKIISLRFLFTQPFIKELRFIQKNYSLKVNIGILKIILAEFQKSYQLKKQILIAIRNNQAKIDETFIYSFWYDYRALAACLIKKEFPNIRTISRSHGGDVYFERHPYQYLPLKKFMLDNLDGIYPISKKTESYLKNKIENNPKFKFFYLGTSNNKIPLNFKENEVIQILSCSHIVPIKRVELIVDILAEITEIKFNWIHIGSNYSTTNFSDYCNSKFTQSNQSFKLLGGLTNEEILAFYNSNKIDLFINLSKSEGVPVSIMEAMSFGIPSIATDVGSTSEIVIEGISGFLTNETPTEGEVKKIILNYQNYSIDQKLRLRKSTFDFWNKAFNAEKNYMCFKREIKQIIENK